jgi:hypothetical protein
MPLDHPVLTLSWGPIVLERPAVTPILVVRACLTQVLSCAVTVVVPPELVGTELAQAQRALADRVKDKQQRLLDKLREEVQDTIRYHEAGWKDRYYQVSH